MSLETSEGLLEAMGTQALTEGSYCPAEEISKKIDNVTLTDVSNVRHLVQIYFLFNCVVQSVMLTSTFLCNCRLPRSS